MSSSPLEIKVEASHLSGILECLKHGKDYAMECLADHEVKLGRSTRKNETAAVDMKKDIEYMEDIIKWVEAYLPEHECI